MQVSSHARTASSTQQDRASASEESGTTPAPSSGGLVPLARVISTILAGPRTWSDKVRTGVCPVTPLPSLVYHDINMNGFTPILHWFYGQTLSLFQVDAFSALTAHVKASVPSTDVDVGGVIDGLVVEPERISQALVRVREVVLESLEDPHHKVRARWRRQKVRNYSCFTLAFQCCRQGTSGASVVSLSLHAAAC